MADPRARFQEVTNKRAMACELLMRTRMRNNISFLGTLVAVVGAALLGGGCIAGSGDELEDDEAGSVEEDLEEDVADDVDSSLEESDDESIIIEAGGWTKPTELFAGNSDRRFSQVSSAASKDGSVHALITGWSTATVWWKPRVWYATNASGKWDIRNLGVPVTGSPYFNNPMISIDERGRVFGAFASGLDGTDAPPAYNGIYVVRHLTRATATAEKIVPYAGALSGFAANEGRLHMLYGAGESLDGSPTNGHITYTTSPISSNNWKATRVASKLKNWASQLALGADGAVRIAWGTANGWAVATASAPVARPTFTMRKVKYGGGAVTVQSLAVHKGKPAVAFHDGRALKVGRFVGNAKWEVKTAATGSGLWFTHAKDSSGRLAFFTFNRYTAKPLHVSKWRNGAYRTTALTDLLKIDDAALSVSAGGQAGMFISSDNLFELHVKPVVSGAL